VSFFQISTRIRGAPQLLQLQQHRDSTLKLPVEMNLVAGEPHEAVRVDGVAKSLRADQRPVVKLLSALLVPWQDLAF
jgi:hypothetical protein